MTKHQTSLLKHCNQTLLSNFIASAPSSGWRKSWYLPPFPLSEKCPSCLNALYHGANSKCRGVLWQQISWILTSIFCYSVRRTGLIKFLFRFQFLAADLRADKLATGVTCIFSARLYIEKNREAFHPGASAVVVLTDSRDRTTESQIHPLQRRERDAIVTHRELGGLCWK